MILDPKLVGDAWASPFTHAVVRQGAIVEALRKIAGDNPAAGQDTYVHNPAAAEAAASAEIETLTDKELDELLGGHPQRAAMFVERAFHDVDEALVILDLPDELVAQIDGHMIALYGAALLAADVRAANLQMDADAGDG